MRSESLLIKALHAEIVTADRLCQQGAFQAAFCHLERAHVLGQSSTYQHTQVHWRMLKVAIKLRSLGEIWGQVIRIIGAATKTPFGVYPKGNTGGANIWFFKPLPVPEDLKLILEKDGSDGR